MWRMEDGAGFLPRGQVEAASRVEEIRGRPRLCDNSGSQGMKENSSHQIYASWKVGWICQKALYGSPF